MPIDGESTRRFNARIEAAVTALGDEALTDYLDGTTAFRQGHQPEADRAGVQRLAPPVGLAERRKMGKAGQRRRQNRRWPDLG
jgi:1-acyl-sn-glycerol-3-phosphate acyltransferase